MFATSVVHVSVDLSIYFLVLLSCGLLTRQRELCSQHAKTPEPSKPGRQPGAFPGAYSHSMQPLIA